MIERQTRGGTIGLYDVAASTVCATCPPDAERGDERLVAMISTARRTGAADGAQFETAICGDCLAEALAILFGRRHLEAGGDVEDLVIPPDQ